MNYYNEIDPFAAQWLRNLIAAGHLPAGDVDERSILDVTPSDIAHYGQCHFFAGIGVWPLALGLGGWGERDGIWTGSCPCQPFSAAGRQLGFADERHLWPAWFHLITQCRPAIVLGEQVASALAWFDLVSDDLESAGYAVGASDICAAGFPVEDWQQSGQHERLLRALYDCPDPMVAAELLDFATWASEALGAHDGDHIRQRLYFVGVADAQCAERRSVDNRSATHDAETRGRFESANRVGECSDLGRVDDSASARHVGPIGGAESQARDETRLRVPGARRDSLGMVDRLEPGLEGRLEGHSATRGRDGANGSVAAPSGTDGLADARSPTGRKDARGTLSDETTDGGTGRVGGQPHCNYGHSSDGANCRTDTPHERRGGADWLFCRDGKWRPVEPGTKPLADAAPGRVGQLRAYGNALDAQTVAAFVASVRECVP